MVDCNSRSNLQKVKIEDEEDEPQIIANKALHPYTGFVHDHAGAPKSTNRFGFPGLDPLWPPTEGELRVGITGSQDVTRHSH